MLSTIDADGNVRLLEPLDAALESEMPSPAELSEQALATDWLRTEEDAAWAHLQLDR
jgi:hypothetical protein